MKLPSQKTLLWLCAFALAVDLFSVVTLVLPWNSTSGVSWRADGLFGIVATNVENPAAAAGLQNGDRTDWRTLETENGYSFVAGAPEKISVLRSGRSIEVTVVPAQAHVWWPFLVRAAAVLWLLAFTVLIVVRAKPTVENRLLTLFLVCMALQSQQTRLALPNVLVSWALVWLIPIFNFGVVLLTLYANRFSTPLAVFRIWTFRATVAIAAISSLIDLIANFPLINFPVSRVELLTAIVPPVLALFALALAIASAPSNEKQRAAWVFAGFGFFVVAASIGNFDPHFGWMRLVQEVSFLAIPLALTYAALARRMFDIGFILNRAAVFTAVSALIVAAFVVLEWALAKWFEDASHTTSLALNATLALAIGFSMRFVHRYVDRFIDTVFFRKRHENETALRRFGREAAFMSDCETLLERTRDEVLARTEASNARIILADEMPLNDPAALALQAWHEPLDLRAYRTSIQGDYAFPMVAHAKFVGALICGEKRNAEHYAPDEIDALGTMAHGVGLAMSDFERHTETAPPMAAALSSIAAQLAELSAGQTLLIDHIIQRDARV